ncbi:MAG TPA: hypothetical protein DIC64_03140 [Alphaproteobacteria bacterium]|nr:hypothetical protein [Alphaproteobacteria bacterium]
MLFLVLFAAGKRHHGNGNKKYYHHNNCYNLTHIYLVLKLYKIDFSLASFCQKSNKNFFESRLKKNESRKPLFLHL